MGKGGRSKGGSNKGQRKKQKEVKGGSSKGYEEGSSKYPREFGIRYVRYVNYHMALVGEIAIRFLSNLAQESIVSYPEFTQCLVLVWHHLGGSFHSLSAATNSPFPPPNAIFHSPSYKRL